MGDVINLRLARKAKAREVAEATAAANRATHGRTRTEKASSEAERDRRDALLDGAAIERDDDPGGGA